MFSKGFLKDENGQGAAEYIMLFGGVIVMAVAVLFIYKTYFVSSSPNLNIGKDMSSVRSSIK